MDKNIDACGRLFVVTFVCVCIRVSPIGRGVLHLGPGLVDCKVAKVTLYRYLQCCNAGSFEERSSPLP